MAARAWMIAFASLIAASAAIACFFLARLGFSLAAIQGLTVVQVSAVVFSGWQLIKEIGKFAKASAESYKLELEIVRLRGEIVKLAREKDEESLRHGKLVAETAIAEDNAAKAASRIYLLPEPILQAKIDEQFKWKLLSSKSKVVLIVAAFCLLVGAGCTLAQVTATPLLRRLHEAKVESDGLKSNSVVHENAFNEQRTRLINQITELQSKNAELEKNISELREESRALRDDLTQFLDDNIPKMGYLQENILVNNGDIPDIPEDSESQFGLQPRTIAVKGISMCERSGLTPGIVIQARRSGVSQSIVELRIITTNLDKDKVYIMQEKPNSSNQRRIISSFGPGASEAFLHYYLEVPPLTNRDAGNDSLSIMLSERLLGENASPLHDENAPGTVFCKVQVE